MLPRRRLTACRSAASAAVTDSTCHSSKAADATEPGSRSNQALALVAAAAKSTCSNHRLVDITGPKNTSNVVPSTTVEEFTNKIHRLSKSIPGPKDLGLIHPTDKAKPHVWAVLRQHEAIWHEILQVILQLAQLLHQRQLKPQDVAEQFVAELKDTAWLWDCHTGTWCTLQDSCICVDDENLAEVMQGPGCGAAAVHFIRFMDHQGQVLGSCEGKSKTSASQGQLLLWLFSLLGVPSVLQSTSCEARYVPTECALTSRHISLRTLGTAAMNWYIEKLELGPGSYVSVYQDHFAATVFELSKNVEVIGASQLECQLTLRLRGTVMVATRWMPKAAVLDGNNLLVSPYAGEAPEHPPGLVAQQAAQELARRVCPDPLHRVSLQKALLRSLESLCRVPVCPANSVQQARQAVNHLLMATYAVTKKPTIQQSNRNCSSVQWCDTGSSQHQLEYMPIMRRWGAVFERVAASCGDLQKLIRPVYWRDRQGDLHPDSENMKRYLNPAFGNAVGEDLLNKPEYILCLDVSQLELLLPVELLGLTVAKDANSKTGRCGEIAATLVVTLLLSQLGVEVDHLHDVWENGDHWDVEGRSPDGNTLKFEVKSTGRTHFDPEGRTFSISKLEWAEATADRENFVIVRPFRVPIDTCSFNRDLEPLLLLFVRNAPKQVANRVMSRTYDSGDSGSGRSKMFL